MDTAIKPKGLNYSAVHLLHRAEQCASDVFSEEMLFDNMTPRQYAVLLTVSQDEGLSQTQLVERTGIDRSTLADIIQRMLKKNLIQRSRTAQDARAYAVRLTEHGRAALNAAEPAAGNADERILSALPPEQRNEFLALLNQLVSGMESAVSKKSSVNQ